jgi:Transglycosylase SLT domain
VKKRIVTITCLVITLTSVGVWLPLSYQNTPKFTHHDPTKSELKRYAFRHNGTDEIQNECLDTLWTMESHWNFRAKGSKTYQGRALGIPQALPAKKMASVSADYRTNPYTQIQWGLKYIKERYGKSCWALKHELVKGWY